MIVSFAYEFDGETHSGVHNTDHLTPAELAKAFLDVLTEDITEVRVWCGTDTNRSPDAVATR